MKNKEEKLRTNEKDQDSRYKSLRTGNKKTKGPNRPST